jgi:hypothetical protein
MIMVNTISGSVTLWSLVDMYRLFDIEVGGNTFLRSVGKFLLTKWHYIPENSIFQKCSGYMLLVQ